MLKNREYYICDRCKKEIDEEEKHIACDYAYMYDLCQNCYDDYKKLKGNVEKYYELIDEEYKKYSFGKYLPKEEK